MKRIDVYITDIQIKMIKSLAKKYDITFSEMLRRLLDQQLIEREKQCEDTT